MQDFHTLYLENKNMLQPNPNSRTAQAITKRLDAFLAAPSKETCEEVISALDMYIAVYAPEDRYDMVYDKDFDERFPKIEYEADRYADLYELSFT